MSTAYPTWLIEGDGSDALANFNLLVSRYLPGFADQVESLRRATQIPTSVNVYSIEYTPDTALPNGVVMSPGNLTIVRRYASVPVVSVIRGLLPSVELTTESDGTQTLRMRINPPSTFLGSEALNATLVRNQGLTLDPNMAADGVNTTDPLKGPDMTFIPGSVVTFGGKSANVQTAEAQGESAATSFLPTIRFKGRDGRIIGLNDLVFDQVSPTDPVSNILFRRQGAPNDPVTTTYTANTNYDANYIRFQDNEGALIGVNNIFLRDGSGGTDGNNIGESTSSLGLAIWAQTNLGGDMIVLGNGDTVNGVTNNRDNEIRFGLGNRASIFFDDTSSPGTLRIVSNGSGNMSLEAARVSIQNELEMNGPAHFNDTVEMLGAVDMFDGLDMHDTDILNVRNLTAQKGDFYDIEVANMATMRDANITNGLTLKGRTGTEGDPYDIWVENSKKADDADLLGGKEESELEVSHADSFGDRGSQENWEKYIKKFFQDNSQGLGTGFEYIVKINENFHQSGYDKGGANVTPPQNPNRNIQHYSANIQLPMEAAGQTFPVIVKIFLTYDGEWQIVRMSGLKVRQAITTETYVGKGLGPVGGFPNYYLREDEVALGWGGHWSHGQEKMWAGDLTIPNSGIVRLDIYCGSGSDGTYIGDLTITGGKALYYPQY